MNHMMKDLYRNSTHTTHTHTHKCGKVPFLYDEFHHIKISKKEFYLKCVSQDWSAKLPVDFKLSESVRANGLWRKKSPFPRVSQSPLFENWWNRTLKQIDLLPISPINYKSTRSPRNELHGETYFWGGFLYVTPKMVICYRLDHSWRQMWFCQDSFQNKYSLDFLVPSRIILNLLGDSGSL